MRLSFSPPRLAQRLSFDLVFLAFALILAMLIALVLWRGDRTYPYVKSSSLPESGLVSADTRQLAFAFNREMDRASVEAGFSIEPAAAGRFSWIGKRMAYSFEEPLEYRQDYQIRLVEVRDSNGVPLPESYEASFSVPRPALFYIGLAGSEADRLMRYSFEDGSRTPLSPPGYRVADYRLDAKHSQAYLLARSPDGSEEPSLYSMDLGGGPLRLRVDGRKFRTFDFQASPDGRLLAVSQGRLKQIGEFQSVEPGAIELMETESGKWRSFWWRQLYPSPFYFSSDSRFLLGIDYSDDTLILPLEEDRSQMVQIGSYSGLHGFSHDGKSILLSQEEVAFAEGDLLLRGADGQTRTLLSEAGQIFAPAFDPTDRWVYFLFSQLGAGGYEKLFHLHRHDLLSGENEPLVSDPGYAQGYFDLSPRGDRIALERYSVPEGAEFDYSPLELLARQTPELWFMDTQTLKMKPLGIQGKKPRLE